MMSSLRVSAGERLGGRPLAPRPIAAFLAAAAMLSSTGHAPGRAGDTQGAVSAPCAAPEYRQLGFWVGDWDAFDVGDPGKPVARARVDVILGGCALREIYEQSNGLVGQSFSMYDAPRKLWHQTWVTNRGVLLKLEGRFQAGSLTLQGLQRAPDGQEQIVRGVWAPQAGGVRETVHTSVDGGATWRPLFDILFRRHKEGPTVSNTPETDRAAESTLQRLNQEYVDAFMQSDVGWYRDNLAEDFVCIESDGTLLGKEEFLRNAARGPDVATYTLEDVRIRMYGDVALVHATGSFTRRDGSRGTSRYTDVYALRNGRWRAISAQITRTRN